VLYEREYAEFCWYAKVTDYGTRLEEFSLPVPVALKAKFNFIKTLAVETGTSVKDLVKGFLDKTVFALFSKIGWDIKKLWDVLKKGFEAYKNVLDAIADYVAKSGVGKWTGERLEALDQFLKSHPKTRTLAGVAVAGLLIYIWLNMAFTGDVKYDFDLTDAVKALTGQFSLSALFAGTDGVKLLLLLATGLLGASFPWPGPTSAKFLVAVVRGIASWAKQRFGKLEPGAEAAQAESVSLTADILLLWG